jgi:hypothetical protein
VSPQFGGTPTGSVRFYKGTTTLGSKPLVNGVASFTTTKLALGTASITAEYLGSGSFDTSSSAALSQVVNQAATTTNLVSSANPSSDKQSVTFTASVAGQFGGTVTGSVVFTDGTTTLKTVSLSGSEAKYTTTTLEAGTHNITATYEGSTDFSASAAANRGIGGQPEIDGVDPTIRDARSDNRYYVKRYGDSRDSTDRARLGLTES